MNCPECGSKTYVTDSRSPRRRRRCRSCDCRFSTVELKADIAPLTTVEVVGAMDSIVGEMMAAQRKLRAIARILDAKCAGDMGPS